MSENETEREVNLSPHVQRSPGQEITFYDDGDQLFCLFVSEPPTEGLFKVVGQTRNPRVLARHDDAVVEGMKITPQYQEDLHRVRTTHTMAGLVHKFPLDEMLNEPALLLERIPHPNMEDWT